MGLAEKLCILIMCWTVSNKLLCDFRTGRGATLILDNGVCFAQLASRQFVWHKDVIADRCFRLPLFPSGMLSEGNYGMVKVTRR
ncbi:hypothetical protein BX666DRAFT_1993134 [Dichotomocladium elegans]|nr:hypothetical protein BX666DRAFT_1993134 [Dichotomocladium elegans]